MELRLSAQAQMQFISSLEKVFVDEPFHAEEITSGTMLQGEVYHFQLAFCMREHLQEVQVHVESPIAQYISVRTVDNVMADHPIPDNSRDQYILHEGKPGMYPDVLRPLSKFGINLTKDHWKTLWFTGETKETIPAGKYPVKVSLTYTRMPWGGVTYEEELLGEKTFLLEVLPAQLPKQTITCTNWFHCDCIATWYGVEVFSEEHWARIRQFMEVAVRRGINFILTPIFTPALDTAVGSERPTVQLIGVKKDGDKYTFNFDRLERWIKMALECGVEYFEMSHLFSQWGAKFAPKIVAEVDGEEKRIFGWDTASDGEAYASFLRAFLPQLINFLNAKGLQGKVFFHLSDEPSVDHIENYRKIHDLVASLIGDYEILDALSHTEFLDEGLLKIPVSVVSSYHLFRDRDVAQKFTYYCCGPTYGNYTNRFLCFPSARTRILGFQMYLEQITGFLHWGFNFWYSQLSKFPIDPFTNTDAGGAFPAGDGFVVYPSEEGPLHALRLEVFYDAFQDYAACQALEAKIGREKVLEILNEGLAEPLSLTVYPHSNSWLLNKREQINRLIAEN